MPVKVGKDVLSIDIFCSRTQSGKTTSIINRMKAYPSENQNIVVPNSIVAVQEMKDRILREITHPVEVIIYKANNKVLTSVNLQKRFLSNYYNGTQTVILFMGNIARLSANNVFAAQHAVQKEISGYEIALHVDESDLYIVGHDPNNWVGKDLALQYVVDSKTPRWSQVCFYTATIYAHAFHVFSKNSILSRYKINWNIDILRNTKEIPYWGYEGIETEKHDDLLNVYVKGEFNPKPLEPIMNQLASRDSIMFVHHRNEVHDKLLHWIQSEYDSSDYPVYCIVVNQDGIRCTSRKGTAFTKHFDTVGEAADWALSEGATRLVWIGDQALTRMQTLRDTNNTLPLSKMVLLTNKDTVETIIQLVGRMTAVLNIQRYPRTLYASEKQIRHFEHACLLNTYFEQQIEEHGTITKETFQDMPAHPGTNLTAKRKMNNVGKKTAAVNWEEDFEHLDELLSEHGRRNVSMLQQILSDEQAEIEIANDPNLRGGQRSAGDGPDEYRGLLEGDPSKEFHKRPTLFLTPDGIWIDNRKTQDRLQEAIAKKITYIVTIDSTGRYLLRSTKNIGKSSTSYDEKIY
jgi:hypothetical protein